MQVKKLSRHDQIDIDKIRSLGNVYNTIIIASARAYELRKGAMPKLTDHMDPYNSGVMTALLEIQEEK
jgi:DNA-directed RNA polymerase subunit K/omega